MNVTYVIELLIGIFCVLFLMFVVLTVKVYLDNERREKCSNAKKRKEYDKAVYLYGCLRKIIKFVLITDMIVDIICFMPGSAYDLDVTSTNHNYTEIMETVHIDPKEQLTHNTDGKVKKLFNDYLFFFVGRGGGRSNKREL